MGAKARKAKEWHPEDIKAEVRKRMLDGDRATLTSLARAHGLPDSACRVALIQPWFKAEQVIAEFIGVPAVELWPHRYDPDGMPRHPRIRTKLIVRRQIERSQKRRAA